MRFMKSSYGEIQQFQGRHWIILDRLENTQAAFILHGIPGHLGNTHTHKTEKSWSQGGWESNTKGKEGSLFSDDVPQDSPSVSAQVSPLDRMPCAGEGREWALAEPCAMRQGYK